jgi:hypothetical protein
MQCEGHSVEGAGIQFWLKSDKISGLLFEPLHKLLKRPSALYRSDKCFEQVLLVGSELTLCFQRTSSVSHKGFKWLKCIYAYVLSHNLGKINNIKNLFLNVRI